MNRISDVINVSLESSGGNAKSNEFLLLCKKFGLTEKEIKYNSSSIEDCVCELANCKKCKSLNMCKNHLKGHVYYPEKKETNVTFNYVACKYLKEFNENLKNKDGHNALLNARMKDIDITDKNRVPLIKWINKFYHDYDASKINKGLYLHGTFGSGKTFLLAALLNELRVSKGADYEIVYLPELLRNLKDNFYSLESKIKYYSAVEILLIDDIGAEKVTDWGRDEILGTILQSRMNNHLTTFFTSNLNIEELERHLAITRDREDVVKSARIIERITNLTIDMEVISDNKRN